MASYELSEVVLHSGVAHIYDVTQAPWRPPRGVRRVIQTRLQLYNKNMSGTILYGLSMLSSTTPSKRLLRIFLSIYYLVTCVNPNYMGHYAEADNNDIHMYIHRLGGKWETKYVHVAVAPLTSRLQLRLGIHSTLSACHL